MTEANPQTEPAANEAESAAAQAGKSLEELLAEAQAKIEQQREAMLRAVAEADNVRKRVQAEAASAQKYALERFAEGLLPVLDSLEAALLKKDLSGVELTLRQMKSALEKQSIVEVNPAPGERFDPHRHQAIAAVPAQAEPNSIVSVMQKGYLLHDRVLRPALVTVAKALENQAGSPISGVDTDEKGGSSHGKDHRHRPRHHQLVRRDHGGRQAQGDRELRRRAHYPVGRGLHGRRRDPGRRAGQAPGRHERQEHALRGEAPHRPPLRGEGSPEGHQPD